MTRAILIGLAGGLLIALRKVLEYKHLVLAYPSSLYGGLLAAIFSAVGIYVGMRWARTREVVVINSAVTFMKVFPVGLVVTLVTAAILRRRPTATAVPQPA